MESIEAWFGRFKAWLSQRPDNNGPQDQGSPAAVQEKIDEAFSASAVSWGFGLLTVPISFLFMLQPEKQLVDHRANDGRPFDLQLIAHALSIAFIYLSEMCGLFLLVSHAREPAPSPSATATKRKAVYAGLFWLGLGLLFRGFLALPATYPLPVAMALLGGAAGTACFIGCSYPRPPKSEESSTTPQDFVPDGGF